MRLIASLAAIACMLTACSNKPEPLTPKQAALVQQIQTASPGSILVFDQMKSTYHFAILCSHKQNGDIVTAIVAGAGVWVCGSMSSMGIGEPAHVVGANVSYIIDRNDPEYDSKVRNLVLEMVRLPTENHS